MIHQMEPINHYFRASKLSEEKFCQILECFSRDLTATMSAEVTRVSLRSVNTLFLRIRARLAERCKFLYPNPMPHLPGSVMGPAENPDGRTQGSYGNTIVFGILHQDGMISTEIFREGLERVVRSFFGGGMGQGSSLFQDSRKDLVGVVDMQFDRFLKVPSIQESTLAESFWAFAKDRLRKFKGLPRHTFHLHLKECEFRFNHRHLDLYAALLDLLQRRPL
jgi:transposase